MFFHKISDFKKIQNFGKMNNYHYGRLGAMFSLKVDNLTFRTTPDQVRQVFEKYGDVGDVYIPRDRYSRVSRGFAFVRYYDRRDAEDAMAELHGRELDGREMRVQMARFGQPQGHRGDGGYGGFRTGRSRSRDRDSRRRRYRNRSDSRDRSESSSRRGSGGRSSRRSPRSDSSEDDPPRPQAQFAVAGSSLGKKTGPQQARIDKFRKRQDDAQAKDEKLGPVDDPHEESDNAEWLARQRMTTMDLDEKLKAQYAVSPEHRKQVDEWQPTAAMLRPSGARPEPSVKVQDIMTPVAPLLFLTKKSTLVYGIDDEMKFGRMMRCLGKVDTFSLDAERNDSHTFLGHTALIQIGIMATGCRLIPESESTQSVEITSAIFLIRPYKLQAAIERELKPLLENPTVGKLMVGMDDAYGYFQKDFDVYMLGVLDLQHIYMKLHPGNDRPSVNKLGEMYLRGQGYETPEDNTFRDWVRPLEEMDLEMIVYAAMDVWVPIMIYKYKFDERHCAVINNAYAASKKSMQKSCSTTRICKCYADFQIAQQEAYNLQRGPERSRLLDLMGKMKDDDDGWFRFELLHQWRIRYGQQHAMNPNTVVSTKTLLEWAAWSPQNLPVTARDFRDAKHPPIDVMENSWKIVTEILSMRVRSDEGGVVMRRLNNTLCHNCLKKGHHNRLCPFQKNNMRSREWYKHHPELKNLENRRNLQNKRLNRREKAAQVELQLCKDGLERERSVFLRCERALQDAIDNNLQKYFASRKSDVRAAKDNLTFWQNRLKGAQTRMDEVVRDNDLERKSNQDERDKERERIRQQELLQRDRQARIAFNNEAGFSGGAASAFMDARIAEVLEASSSSDEEEEGDLE